MATVTTPGFQSVSPDGAIARAKAERARFLAEAFQSLRSMLARETKGFSTGSVAASS